MFLAGEFKDIFAWLTTVTSAGNVIHIIRFISLAFKDEHEIQTIQTANVYI